MLSRRRLIWLVGLIATAAALVVVNEWTRPPSAAELRDARTAVYAHFGGARDLQVQVVPDGHDAYARISWPDGSGVGIELRRDGDGWKLARDPSCVSPACG